MADTADVVIIGAGISGLALAFELSGRRRRRILLLEQKHVGYGASSRNIGRVRTSQFAEPLARFAKNAMRKHARLSDELGSNTLFWRPGYALVFYDKSELAPVPGMRTMLAGLGQETEFHEGEAVFRRLPILTGGRVPAGCLIRPDASVHHDSLLNGYKRAILRRGVEIRENVVVTGSLLERDGSVCGVATSRGDISAPLVVNAAGGWSSEISRLFDVKVPNKPIRREAIVTESAQPHMDTMITFYRPMEGWFHQTLRGETVIGVTDPLEPLGMNMKVSDAHLARAAAQIRDKAPRLLSLRVVRQWAGVYDMTPDRKSMLGPVGVRPGFVQFNGDNGRGIALGPYNAELLAEWLDTGQIPDMIRDFDCNRFEGREDTPVEMGDYYAAYKTMLSGQADALQAKLGP
jgi:sarcosine oxidase subunit beta